MEVKDGNSEYHGKKGYSSTQIKKGKDSMAHYRAAQGVQLRGEALTFGSLLHCLYLEPEELENDFVIYNEADRPDTKHKMSAKKNAAWLEEMQNKADIEGKDGVVSTDQILHGTAMREAAFKNPYIKWLFRGAHAIVERSIYQKMNVVNLKTGQTEVRQVKARPDWKQEDMGLILDIKSTAKAGGASKSAFRRHCEDLSYDLSAAFYLDIQKMQDQENGVQRNWQFVWFVQERDEPYHYNLIYATAEDIVKGRKDYETILSNIVTCEFTKVWPGYWGSAEIVGCVKEKPSSWAKVAEPLNMDAISFYQDNVEEVNEVKLIETKTEDKGAKND